MDWPLTVLRRPMRGIAGAVIYDDRRGAHQWAKPAESYRDFHTSSSAADVVVVRWKDGMRGRA